MNESNTDTTDSNKPLGTLVRRLRQEAGLSMFELAKRSGYDRSNLRRLEEGAINAIAPDTARKLADALDADVEEFYEAIWEADKTYLPSLPTFFRHKYHNLTSEQIAEVEGLVDQMQARNERHGTNA